MGQLFVDKDVKLSSKESDEGVQTENKKFKSYSAMVKRKFV